MVEFGQDFVSKGYSSCWGDAPDPSNHTTFNARTFLQPQLQKACKASDKKAKGDYNPKDHILTQPSKLAVVDFGADNTTKRVYDSELVIPTLTWPSDHGLVFSTFVPATPKE